MRSAALVVLVVALLLGGDRLASAAAESRAEDAIAARLHGVAGVDVDIRSFPFTGRLFAAGRVSRLDVHLADVVGHGIDVADMRFDARGVDLDRDLLLSGKVRVRDVERVLVTARIDAAAIGAVGGAAARLLDGTASATIAGGTIEVRAGSLPPVRFPGPDESLLPCAAEVRVEDGGLVASCEADELPSFIADAVVDVRD